MRILFALGFISLAVLLAGCSNAREELGLKRDAPDEFAVVKRAPLELPPNYDLRPPRPGASRPQEQTTSLQAQSAVYGRDPVAGNELPANASSADRVFLEMAGVLTLDPQIRAKLDRETQYLADQNTTVMQKLGISETKPGGEANIVNAPEEAARLKKNQQEGKPVTDGDTPTIKQ
ncbi:MAG: DUF3035 domain-containing protein [Alphaproteobacteria bacterium]|nr:DUF3035 domain-containing protein [Alphaproteobacteria bacterium]